MKLCLFGIHKWGPWEEVKREDVYFRGPYNRIDRSGEILLTQERRCDICKRKDLHLRKY